MEGQNGDQMFFFVLKMELCKCHLKVLFLSCLYHAIPTLLFIPLRCFFYCLSTRLFTVYFGYSFGSMLRLVAQCVMPLLALHLLLGYCNIMEVHNVIRFRKTDLMEVFAQCIG